MKTQAFFLWTLILGTGVCALPLYSQTPATEGYAEALKNFVDDRGMVDYKALQNNPQALNTYLQSISTLPEQTLSQWSDSDKIAFWINAYNSLTLKVILDHYPIKSSFFRSLTYPKNSIQQIPGVWTKLKFTVLNRPMTLAYIKDKILRAQFNEPRIHMALANGTLGGAPLRTEPYSGPTLGDQLDDQADRFLESLEKLKIDRREGIVCLSPIFKWYAKDFVAAFAPPENMGKHNRPTSALIQYIATHAEALFKPYLYRGDFKVKYLKYDWSLNEQSELGTRISLGGQTGL
ncbi:MAG: DUF547 domain-containing protein [Phycisphaerae bacterium]|nr:DUF547 domain-containing protein [Phycisphaerae bacterium]